MPGPTLFLTSTVVATVIATCANYCLKLWDERRARRDQGTMEALRLAVVLERYAADCAEIVGNSEAWHHGNQLAHAPATAIPVAPLLPGVDWKCLPVEVASKVIALDNEIYLVRGSLNELSYIDEEATYSRTRQFAGKYGSKALDIAEALRRQFKLPDLDLQTVEWDFREQLRAETLE